MVFSGLTSTVCALAKAEASAAMLSLDLCMSGLRLDQDVKAHGTRFGPLSADAMADGFLGILGHQRLELILGSLMVKEGLPGFPEQPCKFAPGIRGAHVDNANRVDARP